MKDDAKVYLFLFYLKYFYVQLYLKIVQNIFSSATGEETIECMISIFFCWFRTHKRLITKIYFGFCVSCLRIPIYFSLKVFPEVAENA
jgi:hypothetical protein